MDKKSIMSKRIFDIEKEVNLAVLAENWVYFDWFKDVEYKIKDDKFYGVKIKLTSDIFHPVSRYSRKTFQSILQKQRNNISCQRLCMRKN